LLSDIDEIPDFNKIEINQVGNKIFAFSQVHSMYKLNLCLKNKWIGSKICKFKNLKSLQWLRSLRTKRYSLLRIDKLFSPRYSRNIKIIENGGWHFGWLRNSESIIKKLESYAHSEHNTDYFKNKNLLDQCIKEKKNFFNKNETLRIAPINEMPQYIQKNFEKYKDWLA
jgi:beta-1,4-mannosyl-glycoprotein beta-1,4-N-acetylglucosaminyltransferase